MDMVSFITTELGDDLIVSFAIADRTDPTEIQSLTLLRSMKFEFLLPAEERGVVVSFEGFEYDDDRDLLKEVRYSNDEKSVHIETERRSHDLDVGRVDAKELSKMRKVFHKMNRDVCFRCAGL